MKPTQLTGDDIGRIDAYSGTQMEFARAIEAAVNAKWEALQAKPQHITDGTPCWCNPELDYVDPVTGAEVWIHKGPQ